MTIIESTLKKIISCISDEIKNNDEIKEKSAKLAREIIKTCGIEIQRYHQNKKINIEKIEKNFKKLQEILKNNPSLYGLGENVSQEVVEAYILQALSENKDLPDPKKINVSYVSYLNGVGDVIGELRRKTLDELLNNNYDAAKQNLYLMELFYNALSEIEIPSGIGSIRKKRDIARSILDKTKSELLFVTSSIR